MPMRKRRGYGPTIWMAGIVVGVVVAAVVVAVVVVAAVVVAEVAPTPAGTTPGAFVVVVVATGGVAGCVRGA